MTHMDRAQRSCSPVLSRPRRRGSRGQALVEFVLVIPVLLLVLCGILDFGFALFSRMTVINAAREGAHAGMLEANHTLIETDAATSAQAQAASGGLALPAPTVTCVHGGAALGSCSSAVAGDSVLVVATFPYRTFFPLLFGATFDLSSSVQMVIEQ
jgi:Flp pilus assembly protein TadG